MEIDFSALSPNQTYHTLIQSIVPRPIAWVLSENASGNYNLAPFSYFTAVSSDPPLLMFSIAKKTDGSKKDTLRNVVVKKKLVIHIADTSLAKAVSLSAENLAYGQSEIEHSQLSTEQFSDFALPRITQAKIAFACSLFEIKEIGNKPMSLVFAKVETAYLDDSIINKVENRSYINAEKLDPLARLGGNDYAGLAAKFTLTQAK